MRLAPNRPETRAPRLMASTSQLESSEVGDEQPGTRDDPDGRGARREHGLGRTRDLCRARRARPGCRDRERVRRGRPRLARVPRRLRGRRPDVPRRCRGGHGAAQARVESLDGDRARLLRGAVRRRERRGLLGPRLERGRGQDHRHRALHDEPRRGLCRTGRDRPQPHRHRQADHGRDVRHRPRNGDRALRPLRHPECVVRAVRRRVGRADPRPSPS